MAENRVDPTVAGLFLIGFITLLFGIIGMQLYLDIAAIQTEPLFKATLAFVGMVGFILLIFAYMASKAGNGFAVALFAFVVVSFFAVPLALDPAGIGFYQGLYIVAIFYLVFTILTLLIGGPKILALMLLVVAFLFFFVGMYLNFDKEPMYAMMFGIMGLTAAALAMYLGLAFATQRLPVV